MNVSRTPVLLILIFLGVGELLAAMATGRSFLQGAGVSTTIKPFSTPMLLPCLLCGRVGGMVSLPSILSRDRGVVSNKIRSSYVMATFIPKLYINGCWGELTSGALSHKRLLRHAACAALASDMASKRSMEPGRVPPPLGPGAPWQFRRCWCLHRARRPLTRSSRPDFLRILGGWWMALSKQVCVPQDPAALFLCRYGSGKTTIGVRVDRQPTLLLVLRFDTDTCPAIFLSPVKPLSYLRLKIVYPRRHRPIRQSWGAPAVLSECENEDPRCFYRGHFLWSLRPRPETSPMSSEADLQYIFLVMLCYLESLFPYCCNML